MGPGIQVTYGIKTTFLTTFLKAAVTPLKQHDIGDKGEFFFDMISSTG